MPASAPLLIELLVEELPAHGLRALSERLCQDITDALRKESLLDGEMQSAQVFATPRRLAGLWPNVLSQQENRLLERRGPSVKASLDVNEKPTMALQGFLRSAGATFEQLTRTTVSGAEYFQVRIKQQGRSLDELLPSLLSSAIKNLPTTKLMTWGDGEHAFLRPVRGVTLLHAERIIPSRLFGMDSGRTLHGHRVLAKTPIALDSAADYEKILDEQGEVTASFARRRNDIRRQLDSQARGKQWLADDALLDEVAGLVERPMVIEGAFAEKFLLLPKECLILTMQKNQKYFPLLGDGHLLPRFLMVSNLPTDHPQAIRRGNERVLRARLSDAQFFFAQDRKATLASRLPRLKNVVFYQPLGSQFARIERITRLGDALAQAAHLSPQDCGHVRQACQLCKADLLTSMVIEFPELQGVMGRYYALAEDLPSPVAQAIEEHYKPRFSGDTLPSNAVSFCVALSDKLDTLVGFFGVGAQPNADKDPFALRRAALAVIRLLRAFAHPLTLVQMLALASKQYPAGIIQPTSEEKLLNFLRERLRHLLREEGRSVAQIEAVLAVTPPLMEIDGRLDAVAKFLEKPEASALIAAHKRMHNILKKSKAGGDNQPRGSQANDMRPHAVQLRAELFEVPAEKALFAALNAQTEQVDAHLKNKEFTEALSLMSALRPQVDSFFDQVLVMAPDANLRNNRLALLHLATERMQQVADVSRLAVENP